MTYPMLGAQKGCLTFQSLSKLVMHACLGSNRKIVSRKTRQEQQDKMSLVFMYLDCSSTSRWEDQGISSPSQMIFPERHRYFSYV